MESKYIRLSEYEPESYISDVPVGLLKVALLRVRDSANIVLQIKFINNSEKKVKSVYFHYFCYTELNTSANQGKEVHESIQNLDCEPHKPFGDRIPFFFFFGDTRRVKIFIDQVVFTDGEVINYAQFSSIPNIDVPTIAHEKLNEGVGMIARDAHQTKRRAIDFAGRIISSIKESLELDLQGKKPLIKIALGVLIFLIILTIILQQIFKKDIPDHYVDAVESFNQIAQYTAETGNSKYESFWADFCIASDIYVITSNQMDYYFTLSFKFGFDVPELKNERSTVEISVSPTERVYNFEGDDGFIGFQSTYELMTAVDGKEEIDKIIEAEGLHIEVYDGKEMARLVG